MNEKLSRFDTVLIQRLRRSGVLTDIERVDYKGARQRVVLACGACSHCDAVTFEGSIGSNPKILLLEGAAEYLDKPLGDGEKHVQMDLLHSLREDEFPHVVLYIHAPCEAVDNEASILGRIGCMVDMAELLLRSCHRQDDPDARKKLKLRVHLEYDGGRQRSYEISPAKLSSWMKKLPLNAPERLQCLPPGDLRALRI